MRNAMSNMNTQLHLESPWRAVRNVRRFFSFDLCRELSGPCPDLSGPCPDLSGPAFSLHLPKFQVAVSPSLGRVDRTDFFSE